METKSLLYGLIGFFIGGLLVAVAATTFNKPVRNDTSQTNTSMNNMSVHDMVAELNGKTGDEYDAAFIQGMIVHHQGAIEMAKLSAENAKHEEIKILSENIISAQEKEITEMKRWQQEWGYSSMMMDHGSMDHQ